MKTITPESTVRSVFHRYSFHFCWQKILVVFFGVVFSLPVVGQTSQGTGNWSSTGSWVGGVVPTASSGSCGSASNASNSTCSTPVTVGTNLVIDQAISISTGVYYITGSPKDVTGYTLTMSKNGGNTSTQNILDIKAGTTTFLGAASLTNANLYVRNGATLILGGLTLNSSGSNNVLIETGGTLIVNGNVVDNDNGGTFIINGYVQINGNFSNTTGNVTVDATSGVLQTTGTMTTSGGSSTINGSPNDCTTGPCSSGSITCGTGGTSFTSSVSPTSQVLCSGQTILPISFVTNATGTLSYQWQSSTTGGGSGFTNITGATSASYTPSQPSVTTWYRMTYTSSNCTSTTLVSPSSQISLNSNPAPVAGSISGGGVTYCSAANSTVLTLTGYTATGFQWQSSSNNVTFTNISGATSSTYTATNVSATTYYRVVVSNGSCNTVNSSSVSITIASASTAAVLSGAATICSGSSTNLAVTITGGTSPFQVKYSDGSITTTVSNYSSGSAISVSPTSTKTYSLVSVISSNGSGCSGTGLSGTPTVTVNAASVAGTISGGGVSVCTGTNSTTLSLSGNTGTVQWQSSPDNSAWSNISGATSTSYTATNLTTTTYYRVVLTNSPCSSANSASVSVTVNAASVAGTISGGGVSVCSGTNSTTLSLSGNTGTVQWQSSPDNSTWSNISGATSTSYTATNLTTTTYYRVVVTNSPCSSANSVSVSVTVNPNSVITSVTGTSPLCLGTTSTYTANGLVLGTGTGAWSSDNTSVATVNSSGLVTAVAAGTCNIIYTITGGCGGTKTAQQSLTVNPLPDDVSNGFTGNQVCLGGTGTLTFDANNSAFNSGSIQYTDGTTTWSQTIASNAPTTFNVAVNPTTSTTYTLVSITNENGCTRTSGFTNSTASVTIYQLPNDVTSTGFTGSTICVGNTGTLTFDALNSTFNSGTIQYSDGTTTWSQSISTNSPVTFNVAVNPAVTTTYTLVSITNETGCVRTSGFSIPSATITVTANNTAGSPSSTPTVCVNSPLTAITITTTGATGISNSGVSGANGLPAGVSATWSANTILINGTPTASGTFNYNIPLTGGCGTVSATGTINVNPNAAISSVSGTSPLCIAGTATYTTSGLVLGGGTGAWSSDNASVATVNSSTGVVTAAGAGTCNIIYTVTGGCGGTQSAQQSLTVNPNASISSVSGTNPLCIAGTATYTTSGLVLGGGTGAWSSDNALVATVNSSTGVVTAAGVGTCNIIYTITGGCGGTQSAQQSLTVNANAAISSVSGTSPLCISGTATYTTSGLVTGGGTGAWSSDNTSVATVNSSTGVVTAVAAGTCNIIYTITGGCGGTQSAQQSLTVTPNAAISSVSGASPLCIAGAATYTTSGLVLGGGTGAWSSDNNLVATVNSSTGVVTAVAAGTCNIIYTVTGGCGGTQSAQQSLTVNPNAAISSVSGTSPLCIAGTATYTTSGLVLGGGTGAWSSDNTLVATVNSSTGVVTAAGAGTCNIIYTVTGGCGGTQSARQLLTVNANAAISSVSGPSPLCIAGTATYTTSGLVLGGGTGAWSSDNTAVATVDAFGQVTAVSAGTCNISYTVTGGCGGTVSSFQSLAVNPTTLISGQSTAGQTQCVVGGAFSPISIAATGNNLTYQWYSNTTSSNSGGVAVTSGSGGTSSIYTPLSAIAGATYYYCVVTGGCGSATSNVSGVFASGSVWNGSGTDWTAATNWIGSCNPGSTSDVVIPGDLANYPTLPGNITLNSLTINSGVNVNGSLGLGAFTLTLASKLQNDGSFNAGTGSVNFTPGTGLTSQVSGSAPITFYNLTLNDNGTSSTDLIIQNTGGISVTHILNVGAATLDVNGKSFTLVSTETCGATTSVPYTNDASIAPFNGGTILGNITVQRFMCREGTPTYYYQVWRDISPPVSNATVHDLQQSIPVTWPNRTYSSTVTNTNSGNPSPVDYSTSSIQIFSEPTNAWTNFLTSLSTDAVTFQVGHGYSVFIYGKDSEKGAGGNGNDLWSLTGQVNIGPVSIPLTYASSAAGWNLVGNPFASTIDWKSIRGATVPLVVGGSYSNIQSTIYIENYSQGALIYSTYNAANDAITNGGSRYIATGQGFFVKATGATPKLTIFEAAKAPGQTTKFFKQAAPTGMLTIALVSDELQQKDETVVRISENAAEVNDWENDAEKRMNRGYLNLSTVSGDGTRYAINTLSIGCSRSVLLDLSDVKTGSHRLEFAGLGSFANSRSVKLKDNLTNTTIDLRQTPSYSFNVDAANPLTLGSGRFSVEFTDDNSNVNVVEINMPDAFTFQSNYLQGNQWYYNGSAIRGATGREFKPTQPGLYRLEVATNGCRVSAEKIFTGSTENKSGGTVRAYPNPTRGTFVLEVEGAEEAHAEVYNSMGTRVSGVDFVNEGSVQQARIDLAGLPGGVYLVRVIQGTNVSVARVIRE